MRPRIFTDRLKKLKIVTVPAAIGMIILANGLFLRSLMVGTFTSFAYILLTGFLIGKVFLRSEEEGFMRFMFGIFILLSLFITVSGPLLIFLKLDFLGLAIIIFAPLILLIALVLAQKPNMESRQGKSEKIDNAPYFSPTYIVYLILVAYCVFLLVQARSGWIYGTVWSVVSPSFFRAYFLAGFILVGIILYSSTRATSKLSLIIPYALIATMVPAIVLYPGNAGDPIDHMGLARMIIDYGNLRIYSFARNLNPWTIYWLVKEKALSTTTAIFAKTLTIDVYWVHTFITPILWGAFIPLATYKISKLLDIGERVSLITSFLAAVYMNFLGWGSRSTGNSFGFIPFLVSVCFTLWYLKHHKNRTGLFLALLTAIASWLAHPLTGIMALLLLYLAIALKKYEAIKLKSKFQARLLLGLTLLICIFAIPAFFGVNAMLYRIFVPQYASEATTRFSLEKLLETDMWALIFGEYATYEFKDLILSASIPFIGIVGLAYALKNETKTQDKKILVLFAGLALMILIVVYRILNYAMVDVLFGPKRLWTFQDMLAIPFAALTISKVIKYFEGGSMSNPIKLLKFERWTIKISSRQVFALILAGLVISAFAQLSVYESYGRFGGMQLTELEVDAVKYIDEHTDGRYVVLSLPATTQVGWGFAGMWNPAKYYVYDRGLGEHPTVDGMFRYMRTYEAAVGYYIASSFRLPNFNKVVAEASQIFGLLKVLQNEKGSVYIFNYKIAPVPPNYPNPVADVTAFHWDTPSGYFIQNGLMRVILNPAVRTLDVRDFWGDLYESVDLNETLVDEKPLGNFESVDYYEPSNDTWINWNPKENPFTSDLPEQFKFRLGFENGSLIGVVKRGSDSVQLWWQDVQVSTLLLKAGDFNRIYIPGLVGDVSSYNVSSRKFGFLYTLSRTDNITLRPAYGGALKRSSLNFSQIAKYCNLTVKSGYLSYDLYVKNEAERGQWAGIELWLPDKIYQGCPPPLAYSLDGGKTWSGSLLYTNFPKGIPVRTLSGTEVNWACSALGNATQTPKPWLGFTAAAGGVPTLPENFTNSGGGQKRILFSLYLPPQDEALVRLGFSVYYVDTLEFTYVFTDSDDPNYGLHNMKQGLVKFYNYGTSSYVGGLASETIPTSLDITEDETGKIKSILLTISGDSSISLLSAKAVDTTIDANGDAIPDHI